MKILPSSPLCAFGLLLFLGGLAGCSGPTGPTTIQRPGAHTASELTGTVHYLERMMLPPGAVLTVTLEDVSLQDVAAVELASFSRSIDSAPPYAFSLSYDPVRIQAGHTYAVRARIEVDEELWFTNDTHIPAFDDSDEPLSIRVSRVGPSSGASTRDPAAMPNASLAGTYWKFHRVNDQPVVVAEKQREPHMVLQEDGQVHGHLGCNRFFGGYQQDGDTLSFSGLGMTQMACLEGMEQEQAIARALEAVASCRITGDTLSLQDANGTAVLHAEAVYLP